jgi:glycerol uptake facilitator-like aquaporin
MAAEAAGTFMLVFVGPASVAATASDASFLRLVFVAAVFAGTVAALILAIGRVSGAHINPAVTMAAVAKGELVLPVALRYWAVQIPAAFSAGLALSIVFPAGASSAHLGSTSLGGGTGRAAGALLEVAGTFALAFAALNAGRLSAKPAWQAAIIGAVLFAVIVAIGPLTGASLNPARSLGPAVASGFFTDLDLYLIAPTVGGLAAGLVARRLPTRARPAPASGA